MNLNKDTSLKIFELSKVRYFIRMKERSIGRCCTSSGLGSNFESGWYWRDRKWNLGRSRCRSEKWSGLQELVSPRCQFPQGHWGVSAWGWQLTSMTWWSRLQVSWRPFQWWWRLGKPCSQELLSMKRSSQGERSRLGRTWTYTELWSSQLCLRGGQGKQQHRPRVWCPQSV